MKHILKAKQLKEIRSKTLTGRVFSEETKHKFSEARKGKYCGANNHFYGKTHSKETKEKLRQAKLGKPSWNSGKKGVYSKETIQKMSENASQRTGENNPNWKGGICETGQMMRLSDKMRKWRAGVHKRDNYTCQLCSCSPSLHVHHIDYNRDNNTVLNLITLCHSCHSKTNGKADKRAAWTKHFREIQSQRFKIPLRTLKEKGVVYTTAPYQPRI